MDYLDDFTKDEILAWLRRDAHYIINPPKKSEMLFIRWQVESERLQEKRNKSSEILNSIDCKTRDELAVQFNNEKDIDKKMEIAKKIQPYQKQFDEWRKFELSVMQEEKELEKLYQSIDEARE